MKEAMTIQGTPIQIKEYDGKRVVTFKDIDTVHKRPDGTARRRFHDNRQRFISGVDFYRVTQASEIRTLGLTRPQGGIPNEIILVTETGYLMLVKSFTDDLAWNVQRELVDSYFRARMDDGNVSEIIQSGVPTVVIATDKLIRCAEIMAGCLESNRPYVLNILRNIVPDIDETDLTEKVPVKKRRSRSGYDVGWNYEKFDNYLHEKRISSSQMEKDLGVTGIADYRKGRVNPGTEVRIEIEVYLNLPRGFFDRRKRRVKTNDIQ